VTGGTATGGTTTGSGGAGPGPGGTSGGAAGQPGGAGSSGNAGGGGGGAVPTGAPGVRIVGRTAPGTMGGTRFEWSGSSVSARFMGTQVSAQLNDGNNGNSFEVVIDGGTPKKLFTTSAQTLVLATGLPNAIHELLLWRDTEANVGPTEFIGLTNFGMGGALLAPPPAPDRRIEIVGDSFSVGAGIEGPPCSGNKIENDYLSYGSIAARSVKADLVTIAWSGIGVWRNYGTATPTPNTVIPARYDYAIPTDMTPWDFSKYQPDVVIMNLTNNDFSVGDPGQPYIDAYLKLVRHIRSNYPKAYIMNVIEWMTADTTINAMVATLKAGGDMNVGTFDMRPYANRKACDHPDMAASQAMGDALAAELRKVLTW
jgi:lysophospholipase L1-like esterase